MLVYVRSVYLQGQFSTSVCYFDIAATHFLVSLTQNIEQEIP